MERYDCINCLNLKTRVVKARDVRNLTPEDIRESAKKQDSELPRLGFPFNFTAYKRLKRYKECAIVYCSEHMLQRDLYIFRKNIKNTVSLEFPCPKYK